jgi:SOS-response transcriptional repressor LexA
MNDIRKKVVDMLFERGKTLKEASLAIGKSHSYLQHFVKLGKPRQLPKDVRDRLARFLNVPEIELRDHSVTDSKIAPSATSFSHTVPLLVRDLPVLSRPTLGGLVMDNVSISEYVDRPDSLKGVAEAFAVYMMEDTMEPRFYGGELLYCHPARPPFRGDSVVMEHSDGTAIVRQLVCAAPAVVTVKQFNPPEEQVIPRMRIKGIYLIVGARFR